MPTPLPRLPVDWQAPAGVQALMTVRDGGVSTAPYASLNLGDHVGDLPTAVTENRRRLADAVDAVPVWLEQVHGVEVIDAAAALGGARPRADGSFTTAPGIACVVLVADCLPVLLAARNGRAVGAAHAGWRGLAAGVLDSAVAAVSGAAECEPRDLIAWLGPCIGPDRFEVGADVRSAFGQRASGRFTPSAPAADGSPRWLADLPGLARDGLRRAGVAEISGGRWCTVSDASRFFSYRRDGTTGRLAAAVWIER